MVLFNCCLQTDLSNLEIVKVAIETSNGDVNERLKAKNAIFYIAFKGLATAGGLGEHEYGIGKHVVRKAIIKRSVHECTGNLSLTTRKYSFSVEF